MTDDERDRLLAELIEHPYRGDRERILRDAHLSDRDREDVMGLVHMADALWLAAQNPPALEDDPVAVRLGLIPGKPSVKFHFRWARPRFTVYRAADRRTFALTLNRYPGVVIGAALQVRHRAFSLTWGRPGRPIKQEVSGDA